MVKHTVRHFELFSTDLERTTKFLEGLFGWEFKVWSKDYLLFDLPDGPDGGIMKVDEMEPSKFPCIYIEVDEIDSYLEKAIELGGGIKTSKTEIPTLGWYAHLVDPDGNIIGILNEFVDEDYDDEDYDYVDGDEDDTDEIVDDESNE